jgi:hypothetical protein
LLICRMLVVLAYAAATVLPGSRAATSPERNKLKRGNPE